MWENNKDKQDMGKKSFAYPRYAFHCNVRHSFFSRLVGFTWHNIIQNNYPELHYFCVIFFDISIES